MHSRLAIDYGAAFTRAVLIRPGGVWTVLQFDGGPQLSSAAHVSAGGITTGAGAWRQATTDPDGFVPAPLRAGTGQIRAAGTDVEVAELAAATLRQVAAEAQRAAGEPVDDVWIVVPAGWGPRRRTWLRTAARKAGLPVTRLVEAPVAAAGRLTPSPALPGTVQLILDIGAGCEVTVLQHDPGGPQVLSTLADPDAGGDRIDTALATLLAGTPIDGLPTGQRWPLLAAARAAKEALSYEMAVTLPMPGDAPPMVVGTVQLVDAAQPVFERVGELAAEALANADLTLDDVHTVHLIGAQAITPTAAPMIAAKLGTQPEAAEMPQLAAVLGAANAAAGTPTDEPADAAAATSMPLPPLRRLITLVLPGLASLLLYAHFVFGAEFNNGTPARPGEYYYVLATWGELAMAAILAAITFLQAASLFAALLDQRHPRPAEQPPAGRITAGILLAIAAGLATASLYAVTAAVFFNQPVAGPLRWALLPILPAAAAALTVAALAWRHRFTPAGGWDSLLTFPASSLTAATLGTLAVTWWWQGGLPWWLNDWAGGLGLVGGLLIGVAGACALVRHPVARIILALLLGLFTMIISRSGLGILAVIYALTVAVWWARHAWTLTRTRATQPIR